MMELAQLLQERDGLVHQMKDAEEKGKEIVKERFEECYGLTVVYFTCLIVHFILPDYCVKKIYLRKWWHQHC